MWSLRLPESAVSCETADFLKSARFSKSGDAAIRYNRLHPTLESPACMTSSPSSIPASPATTS